MTNGGSRPRGDERIPGRAPKDEGFAHDQGKHYGSSWISPVKKWWSTLAFAALLMTGVGLAQTGAGRALLQDVGLVQAPRSYTELAFTAPGSLPDQLTSSHTDIKVSFGIRNASGSSRTYQWSIAFARSGQSTVKASGVVKTSAQGTATVVKTVKAACVGGRLQVVVHLASPAESIAFWTACPSLSGGHNKHG